MVVHFLSTTLPRPLPLPQHTPRYTLTATPPPPPPTTTTTSTEAAGIPVPSTKRGEPPFSMDANLLHISYEGNALEDPWVEPDESMFTRSVSPEAVRWCSKEAKASLEPN